MGAYAQISENDNNQTKLYDNNTKKTQSVVASVTNSSDDYLSITTQHIDLESSLKTLFNDNMTFAFKVVKDNKSDNATLSNDKDAKVGTNSLRINVALKKGDAY